jgi:hypothetical protein
MSRNGSGTYSVPNTFTSGTTITASGHNENWSDVASEMTNSVAADGQTSMTAPLKAANGSVSLPALTFASDTDSGMYRIGANNVGVAVNATKILDVSTTGLNVVGSVQQNGFNLLPIGLGPLPWSGETAPSGWLLTGGTYSRTTYAALWAFAEAQIALGSTFFTNGDGSTTFVIAAMNGYAPAGVDAVAERISSFTETGATAGASTRTIAQANLPNVSLSAGNLTVSGTISNNGTIYYAATNNSNVAGGATFPDMMRAGSAYAPTWSGTVGGSVPLGGSGTALSIIQPVRAFNFIVFAGV